ncbi:hypothetical protein NXX51_13900 [Bacteroides thetaiotaomicron]|uniref:hypothetical protein n=1 Tax=Bacteroides thetaiotaomicron TaxID=818 RepID=UPI00216466F7|nr:hypothetical protein [Bacteroides thetaiotaomicron]UVS11068.1 hypothetical protein NXX51_13900 [Bacteroides thetaiotaomicron]
MGKKKNKKRNLNTCYVEVEKNLGMWQDYMQYGPQYDTNNDCPINPGESDMVEQLSFKKLSVDTRKQLRATMVNLVLDYWQTERLIPEGAIIKEFRNAAIKGSLLYLRTICQGQRRIEIHVERMYSFYHQ